MSVIGSNILAGASAQGAGAGYTIDQSLRFNDDDSAYLSRTPASAGNRKTWTWSGWVKRGNINTEQYLFAAGSSPWGNPSSQIYFSSAGNLIVFDYTTSTVLFFSTSSLYRDPSSWYHVVVSTDTTQATGSDRVKIYVNGSRITDFGSTTIPSQNFETQINLSGRKHYIGSADPYSFFDGYLAEVHFIDGQALDPSYFGETDEDYGHWKPIAYTGSYGTNGFYLDFSNLGEDQAGSNDFTANNLAATDVVLDSPTNNFCTLNPLSNASSVRMSFSEGNLKMNPTLSNWSHAPSNWKLNSGKWYWELLAHENAIWPALSTEYIANTGQNSGIGWDSPFTAGYSWTADGNIAHNGSYTWNTSPDSFTTGDILGLALDVDNGSWSLYKNGTLSYTLTGQNFVDMYPDFTTIGSVGATGVANFGQDSSFAGNKTAQNNTDANGVGDFYYAPPSGFLALCTANLSDPAVVPGENFNTVLYTGTGSDRSVTGVGFQPDWTWIKQRAPESISHELFDNVRGVQLAIMSDSTAAEQTARGLSSFDSDGFSITGGQQNTNQNTYSYVAWNWKANNTSGSSNTDGSITSTVAANVDAGFSIVGWTGTGSNGTLGHGLSSAPEMIIVKNRNTAEYWVIGNHDQDGWDSYTYWPGSWTNYSNSVFFQSTAPTSSVFYIGTDASVNKASSPMIAYCFHSVDGYSKIGTYTGNGSSDGTFVYTGFRPAWVMINDISNNNLQWIMFDSKRSEYNVVNDPLTATYSSAESVNSSTRTLDFLSNGFKLRDSYALNNSSTYSTDYVYMAFAEYPFSVGGGIAR